MPPRREAAKVNYQEVPSDDGASEMEEERPQRVGMGRPIAAVAPKTTAAAVNKAPSKNKSKEKAPAASSKSGGKQKAEQAPKSNETAPKRARTSKATGPRKLRGSTGRLEYFKNMPLDILAEICSLLGLDDLLHLSRVDRNFRRVLMTKQSRHLWTSARQNSGLPVMSLPMNLSEPQLAAFLYDKVCMDCGRDRALLVDYYLRKRWCKDCKVKDYLDEDAVRMAFQFSEEALSIHTLACTPSHPVANSRTWYRRDVVEQHYSLANVRSNNAHLRKLETSVCGCEQYIHPIRGGGECSPGTPLGIAVGEGEQQAAASQLDGAALTKWDEDEEKERAASVTRAKEQRWFAITDRLIELGYDERDFTFEGHKIRKLVVQTTPLTEKIWSTISDAIIEDVEKAAERRASAEAAQRSRVRAHFIRTLHDGLYKAEPTRLDHLLFPNCDDFLQLDSVRPHWQDDKRRRTTIDEAAWEAALPDVEADIEEAKHVNKVRRFHTLLKLLRRAKIPIDNLNELVERSTLPPHGCDFETDITPEEMEPILSLYVAQTLCIHRDCSSTHSLFDVFGHEDDNHDRSGSNSMLSYKWMRIVREVAEQVGLDVLEVTEEELEALGPAFECTDCAEVMVHSRWVGRDGVPHAILPIKASDFTWSELVRHVCQYHKVGISEQTSYWKTDPGVSLPRPRFVDAAEAEDSDVEIVS